jgi:hypothetical protein
MKLCGDAMASIGVPGAEGYIAEAEQYRARRSRFH